MVAVAIALRVETLVVAGYHFGDFQHRVVVQLGQRVFLLQRLSCNRRCCGAGRLLSCGGGLVMLCLNDMASMVTNTIITSINFLVIDGALFIPLLPYSTLDLP